MGCVASRDESATTTTTIVVSGTGVKSGGVVHHPPLHRGDSHHVVSLTSTTYGFASLFFLQQQEDDHHSTSSSSSSTNPITFTTNNHITNPNPNPNTKPLWRHLSEESLLADMHPSSLYSIPTTTKALSVVFYSTSLHGVRKTYDDCCTVRSILKGLHLAVDERDVSMDATYRNELQGLLEGKPFALPRVFVGGKCIGGAEELRRINDSGELRNLLKGFGVADEGVKFGCVACGGVRFAPCGNCDGSRKVFVEKEGQVVRCSLCNENGLVRCSYCSS